MHVNFKITRPFVVAPVERKPAQQWSWLERRREGGLKPLCHLYKWLRLQPIPDIPMATHGVGLPSVDCKLGICTICRSNDVRFELEMVIGSETTTQQTTSSFLAHPMASRHVDGLNQMR